MLTRYRVICYYMHVLFYIRSTVVTSPYRFISQSKPFEGTCIISTENSVIDYVTYVYEFYYFHSDNNGGQRLEFIFVSLNDCIGA